jgi:transcriptional regulator GlxA family with amidase domain
MNGMNEHTYRRMLKARSMLDHSLGSFDLPRLARDLNMTPGSLVRTFKQAFDESPYRYLRRRRVERAKLLLESTTDPTTDIGFAVGFVDRAAFDSAFAEFAGTSPEVYRRRAGRRQPGGGDVAGGVVDVSGRVVDRSGRAVDGAAPVWARLLGGK